MGGWSNGGVSFGNTEYDNCAVPDVPAQFCHYYMPWEGQTQDKFQVSYPLPYDFQFAGTYLGAPGLPQAGTRSDRTLRFEPSLGRSLTNTTAQVHPYPRAERPSSRIATTSSISDSAAPSISAPCG